MAKGVKTGGRTSIDGEPREKNIKVRSSTKPEVERARDLLDNPITRDALIDAMNTLQELARQAKD